MEGEFFNGVVAAIHFVRAYLEQLLLGMVTFLEDLSKAFDFFKSNLLISPL